jgi:hypothetical protein
MLLSSFSARQALAEVPKSCLQPFTETVEKAEANGQKPLTYVIQAPADCQYFTIGELEPAMRTRVFKLVKEQNKVASLDTKLTTVFGLLKLTPTAVGTPTRKFDPCEELFFDLARKKTKYLEQTANISDRKDCFKLSSQFLNEMKKFPPECDIAIEVTSRDFRDLMDELGQWYKMKTLKPLSYRLSFAFADLRGLVGKTINGRCGSI